VAMTGKGNQPLRIVYLLPAATVTVVILLGLVDSCSSRLARAGATSFAKNYLRDLAKEKGMQIYHFRVRGYDELPVYRSDRENGITRHVLFSIAYEWYCPGGRWSDGSASFRLIRQNGKWEFFQGRATYTGWSAEWWSCDGPAQK
jgi:hypothetical protein